MLIHFIKSINWIDVAFVCLFVRMIYIGVKNGFITELFKFLGIILAVYMSLHYYTSLAAWALKVTGLSIAWDIIIFSILWLGVVMIFKFIRDGILVLFKIETTHQGFDQYAAGILASLRGILVCSLTIYLILLINSAPLIRMTAHSYSYKIAGKAAVGVYSALFHNVTNKLWDKQHYNEAVGEVVPLK